MNEKGSSLIRYALGNLMEEMISSRDRQCIACPLHENEFGDLALIVSPQEQDRSTTYEELYRCANRVIRGAQKYLRIRITVGISDFVDGKELYSAFKEALTYNMGYLSEEPGHIYGPASTASSYVEVTETKHPLSAADAAFQIPSARQSLSVAEVVNVTSIKAEALDTVWSNRMLHALKLMDANQLSELLDEQTVLLRELVKQTSAFAVRREMNQYIGNLLSKWQELNAAKYTSESCTVTYQQKLQLYRCALGDWKSTIMSTFLKKNTTMSACGQKHTIDAALRYIHDNYHLGISLNHVAEKIYLNPSYFSRLFHDKVGETLSRYLVRIRMSKAKELLEHTPLKIYEIADRVGYKDFRHFVKTFKEYEGMTPAQFRNHVV